MGYCMVADLREARVVLGGVVCNVSRALGSRSKVYMHSFLLCYPSPGVA